LGLTWVAGPYPCNGLTTQFPFDFKVFNTGEVVAILSDANDVESTLALGTDYTIALNDNQDANPGGTLTTLTSYVTGYKVTLTSEVPNTQPETLTNQGGFYPKVIEHALDRLTIQMQQVDAKVNRAVQVPISSDTLPNELLAELKADTAAAQSAANAAAASEATATGAAGTATAMRDEILGSESVQIVADHIDSIDAVAANEVDINTVAASVDAVVSVAGDLGGTWAVGVLYDFGSITVPPVGNTSPPGGNIVIVANSIEDVNTVAEKIGDVSTVSTHLSSMLAVANDIDNVIAVADDLENIDAVADNAANISTVAGANANVNTVAINVPDMATVASNIEDVQAVAGIAADVTTVADADAAIVALGNDLTGSPIVIDYGSVADAASNPAAPGGVLGAVWVNAKNIAVVAENIAAIIDAANNLPAILAALSGALVPTNNLSDLADPATARANIGLADLGSIA